MSAPSESPTRSFWIISTVALLWNALGIVTYLLTETMSYAALAAMPEAERDLYTNVPGWVTASYAVAVFGGTVGSLGLLLRRAWAVPVLGLSIAGILLQMGHALLASQLLAVKGAGAAVLPLLIVVVAVFLLWYAVRARSLGMLR
jgi:hypothetical protein